MDRLAFEVAGGDERAMLKQVGTWVAGRIAARDAAHDIAEDLVPVRGQRHDHILQRSPAPVRGDGGPEQRDALGAGVPPVGPYPQAVEAEAEPDFDARGYAHDGALVLPPEGGAGVAPHGEVLVPGVRVGQVAEQIDHRLPHPRLAVTPHSFPRLPRRLTT